MTQAPKRILQVQLHALHVMAFVAEVVVNQKYKTNVILHPRSSAPYFGHIHQIFTRERQTRAARRPKFLAFSLMFG